MSTFGGKIEEIPGISVDRFDKDNLESEAYFLSHCHVDHMVGLQSKVFQSILVEYNRIIYTSDISREILKQLFPSIQYNIKVLDMYAPTLVMLEDKAISVTPLPAGHCPGSVMFLFESDVIILYTGDYRINKSDFKKFKAFYNSLNEIKRIQKIYLDTTFFSKSYLAFPKRADSLNELCKLVKDWIDKGENHIIKLIPSAKYGYEYVFTEIYKKIGMPVHISYSVYKLYSIIPEMDNCVTLNGSLTRIHSSCGPTYRSICNEWNNVRPIKISAFRWTHDQLENGPSDESNGLFYVCYSTHASYEEGVELLRLLKPKAIEPCVRHNDPHFDYEMMQLLDEVLSSFITEESTDDKPILFDTKVNPVERESRSSENNIGSLNDKYRILDSPPRESIQNIRTFLKRHGSGIGLDKSYERLENEAEKSGLFNFDDEFGISEEIDTYETKESFKTETKINVTNFSADSNHRLLIVESEVESVIEKEEEENVEILKTVDVKDNISEIEKKQVGETIHLSDNNGIESVKNNEKPESNSNSQNFCSWFVNLSPSVNFKCEKLTTEDLNNLEDFERNKSRLETPSEKVEDDTNLLNQLFFIDSPPPIEGSVMNESVSNNLENDFKSLDSTWFDSTQETALNDLRISLSPQKESKENISIESVSRVNVTKKERTLDNISDKPSDIIYLSDSEDEDNNEKDNTTYYPPIKKFFQS